MTRFERATLLVAVAGIVLATVPKESSGLNLFLSIALRLFMGGQAALTLTRKP